MTLSKEFQEILKHLEPNRHGFQTEIHKNIIKTLTSKDLEDIEYQNLAKLQVLSIALYPIITYYDLSECALMIKKIIGYLQVCEGFGENLSSGGNDTMIVEFLQKMEGCFLFADITMCKDKQQITKVFAEYLLR